MEDFDDPLARALSSRRIPHNRSKHNSYRGRGYAQNSTASGTGFDPLRALGYYEVHVGSKKREKQARQSGSASWMEIHELTEADDGLIGTMEISFAGADAAVKQQKGKGNRKGNHDVKERKPGRIQGMFVLAGSRKGLQDIVERLNRAPEPQAGADGLEKRPAVESNHEESSMGSDGEVEEEADVFNENSRNLEESNNTTSGCRDASDGDHHGTDSDDSAPESSLDATERNPKARDAAFEKNTFRNPKFWLRYQAHVRPLFSPLDNDTSTPQVETESNMGYLIFSSNVCDRFEGTISCEALGWDNLRMTGWKKRPQRAKCPFSWSEFT